MANFTAKITDPVGLHSRPASEVAQAAAKFESDIKITSGDKSGNLKSIINIIALGIKQGEDVTIEATGADADAAVAEIEKVMKDKGII